MLLFEHIAHALVGGHNAYTTYRPIACSFVAQLVQVPRLERIFLSQRGCIRACLPDALDESHRRRCDRCDSSTIVPIDAGIEAMALAAVLQHL